MRNKVRKAEKNGVFVTEDTPADFSRRFFGMLKDVFHRQGATLTYSLEFVDTVVRVLARSGNLKTLTAWHGDEALASLILLVDGRSLYFWGGASYTKAHRFGANDMMHWHALRFATNEALLVYDTCGGGHYKEKFGGTRVCFPAGYLALNPLLGLVRSAGPRVVRARQLFLGKLQSLGKGAG